MEKLMIKFFRYSLSFILLALLAAACSPSVRKDYRKCNEERTFPQDIIDNPPGISKELSFYNMQVDYGKNHFSGMLIVKSVADTCYRVALASHFGMSIFDFNITPSTFYMKSCMDALNKKSIFSLLRDDFRSILFLDLHKPYSLCDLYVQKQASDRYLYHLKGDKINSYYELGGGNKLSKINKQSAIFKSMFYYTIDSKGQVSIVIKHKPVKLMLTIEKIDASLVVQ